MPQPQILLQQKGQDLHVQTCLAAPRRPAAIYTLL